MAWDVMAGIVCALWASVPAATDTVSSCQGRSRLRFVLSVLFRIVELADALVLASAQHDSDGRGSAFVMHITARSQRQ